MPKYLYHGSGKAIFSKYLKIHKSTDKSKKANCLFAVYATDKKDIAIGMSLTSEKNTSSFADYSKKPFKVIFVRGKPKQKYVYVYKVLSKNFIEKPKKSHQWVSEENVLILKREKFLVSKLNVFWRLASLDEKKRFYLIKKSIK